MYPHIYEIHPATRFYGKIEKQYTVHLCYPFCAAENAVCRSHSTVHLFNHFTTMLRTSKFTQVSHSSSTVTKGYFSKYTFLNFWKRLLFAGDGFAGVRSFDSAMLSLEHETFFTNGALIPKIYLACVDAMFFSGNFRETFFVCFLCMHRALPRANLHVSIFCASVTRPKVALVSSSTKA